MIHGSQKTSFFKVGSFSTTWLIFSLNRKCVSLQKLHHCSHECVSFTKILNFCIGPIYIYVSFYKNIEDLTKKERQIQLFTCNINQRSQCSSHVIMLPKNAEELSLCYSSTQLLVTSLSV